MVIFSSEDEDRVPIREVAEMRVIERDRLNRRVCVKTSKPVKLENVLTTPVKLSKGSPVKVN